MIGPAARSAWTRWRWASALLVLSCSVDRREVQEPSPESGAGSTSTGGATSSGGAASTGGATSTGGSVGLGGSAGSVAVGGGAGSGGTATGDGGGCSPKQVAVAEKIALVDAVWAIDGSSSMNGVSQSVSLCLWKFYQQLDQYPIDLRIIALHGPGFCAAQLSGGTCPGGSASYFPVSVTIGETDALQVVVDSYSSFATHLRPNAVVKALAVVSDNNSALSATSFVDSWLKKGTPPNSGWIYAALVTQSTCSGSSVGTEYMSLIGTYGGVLGNLCAAYPTTTLDPDGFAVKLATTIKAAPGIGCAWEIPTPPAGHDKKQVTVAISSNKLLHKPNPASCGTDNGWYFDDPQSPTQIVACPALCKAVRDKALSGTIALTFACP